MPLPATFWMFPGNLSQRLTCRVCESAGKNATNGAGAVKLLHHVPMTS